MEIDEVVLFIENERFRRRYLYARRSQEPSLDAIVLIIRQGRLAAGSE
jgi:hypothetical protein